MSDYEQGYNNQDYTDGEVVEEEIIVKRPQGRTQRRIRTRGRYSPTIVILGLVLSIMGLVTFWGLLIFMLKYIWIVGAALIAGTVGATALGLGYGVVKLIRYATKAEIVEVAEIGTVILKGGTMRVVSQQPLYAMETTTLNLQPQLPMLAAPKRTQENVDVLGIYERETVTDYQSAARQLEIEQVEETDDRLIDQHSTDQELAKTALQVEDEAIKARIKKMYDGGIALRLIAKSVRLDGSRYDRFKRLCGELGIQGKAGELD